MKIGWFTPISQRSGISKYSRMVLDGIKAQADEAGVEVIVFRQPTDDPVEDMPFPVIELSEGLLESDFHVLCDIAVYNIGNNELHHSLIYKAMMMNPGVVVLHDFVYQHYLAGKNYNGSYVATSYVSMVHSDGGPEAFEFVNASGVLPAYNGQVRYIPWESEWAVNHPMSVGLANFGLGTVVHSDYARTPLEKDGYLGDILQLFMPLDTIEAPAPLNLDKQIQIVCGGHIQPTKGLGLLLRALGSDPKLRDNFKVTICGFGSDPSYLSVLETQIETSGLQSNVKVIANVDENQFGSIMNTADIFYNLRYPNTEGASLSLAEQLSAGRPIIAYRSGSFAEVSDDICYFLEVGSDTEDLAKLLGDIAADRAQFGERGARAYKSVADNSHLRYGSEIVTYLKDNIEKFKSRQNALQSFPYDKAINMDATEKAWFDKFATNRSEMSRFLEEKLLMPRGFSDLSDLERGRFVAATYLVAEVSAKEAVNIGKNFGRDSVMVELERLGAMKHIGQQLLSTTPNPETLYPLRNRVDIWRVVTQLPPKAAQRVIRLLLQIEDSPIFDEMSDMPCSTVLNAFERQSHSAEKDAAFRDVLFFLKERAVFEGAQQDPVLLGEDITGGSAEDISDRNVRFSGFHDPEDFGIWTSKKVANLTLQIDDGDKLSQIVTQFKAFKPTGTTSPSVVITVREVDTGRKATVDTILEGTAGQLDYHDAQLDIPDFEGTLNIQLEAPMLFVPNEEGISADTRSLGIMLKQLELK